MKKAQLCSVGRSVNEVCGCLYTFHRVLFKQKVLFNLHFSQGARLPAALQGSRLFIRRELRPRKACSLQEATPMEDERTSDR